METLPAPIKPLFSGKRPIVDPHMKSGALKEEERRLKGTIISNLELQFVDEFVKWNERMVLFNEMVGEYNGLYAKRLKPIVYDEFCKLFIKGSKAILNEHVRIGDIIPNAEEIIEIKRVMENEEDPDEFKAKYGIMLKAKFELVKRNLAATWDKDVLKKMVVHRYGASHYDGMLIAKERVMKRNE